MKLKDESFLKALYTGLNQKRNEQGEKRPSSMKAKKSCPIPPSAKII